MSEESFDEQEYLTDSSSDHEGFPSAEIPKDDLSKLRSRLRREQTVAPQQLGNAGQRLAELYETNRDVLQNNIHGIDVSIPKIAFQIIGD
jgi:hypothetical protein